MPNPADMQAVVAALRENDRFVVTSHEAPDGDALGSLLATGLALGQLGKDAVMFLGGPAPLPGEYRFLELEQLGLHRERPADLARARARRGRLREREPRRRRAGARRRGAVHDQHRPPSRQPALRRREPRSSPTPRRRARCSRDVFRELGVELTPEIAEALYIALVTDTGRFQYANTTPKALRLAADLVEAGADVHRVFQGVYENVQFAKLKLLARALERAQVLEGGEIVVSHLLRDDFEDVGATEPYSEGIIDVLRSVEGSLVSALIREPPRDGGAGPEGVAALVRRRGGRERDRAQVAAAGGTARRRASRATSRWRRSPSSSCARSSAQVGAAAER